MSQIDHAATAATAVDVVSTAGAKTGHGCGGASSSLRLFDAVEETAVKVSRVISQRIDKRGKSGYVLFQQQIDQKTVRIERESGRILHDARGFVFVQNAGVNQVRHHVGRLQMIQDHLVDWLRFEDLLFAARHAEKQTRIEMVEKSRWGRG